ncbi:MAG: hypothetical protein R3F61_27945 [Myxococcota bacterium]
MNPQLQPAPEMPVRPTVWPVRVARFAVGVPVAWMLGGLACTGLVSGVLALGFVMRWMAWTTERVWWAQSAREAPFDADAPRWILAADPGWRGWIGGLLANLRVGVGGTVHSLLALLPSAALWMFAWRYGWDNSFTKGYDMRSIGPLTGLAGVAVFVGTMLVLPLAQARYATTRSWRAFWDVGLLATLVRRSWTGAVPLAAAHALAGIPFTFMWIYPVFAPIARPEMADWTDAHLLAWLRSYFLVWAILGFATTFALKQLAARWYASALLDAVRSGTVSSRQLDPVEVARLTSLGLLRVKDLSHRHPLVRAADWTASAVGRSIGLASAAFLWGFVAFQLFTGAFFHYRPVIGWVNQPLLLVPAFSHVPAHLTE